MEILKRTRGTGEVFDTENIESKTKYPHLPPTSKASHHYHKTTLFTVKNYLNDIPNFVPGTKLKRYKNEKNN